MRMVFCCPFQGLTTLPQDEAWGRVVRPQKNLSECREHGVGGGALPGRKGSQDSHLEFLKMNGR